MLRIMDFVLKMMPLSVCGVGSSEGADDARGVGRSPYRELIQIPTLFWELSIENAEMKWNCP